MQPREGTGGHERALPPGAIRADMQGTTDAPTHPAERRDLSRQLTMRGAHAQSMPASRLSTRGSGLRAKVRSVSPEVVCTAVRVRAEWAHHDADADADYEASDEEVSCRYMAAHLSGSYEGAHAQADDGFAARRAGPSTLRLRRQRAMGLEEELAPSDEDADKGAGTAVRCESPHRTSPHRRSPKRGLNDRSFRRTFRSIADDEDGSDTVDMASKRAQGQSHRRSFRKRAEMNCYGTTDVPSQRAPGSAHHRSFRKLADSYTPPSCSDAVQHSVSWPNVGSDSAQTPASNATKPGGKVPYRRRNNASTGNKHLRQLDGASAEDTCDTTHRCVVSHVKCSGSGYIEEMKPQTQHHQNTKHKPEVHFHQLPAILITSVRFISKEEQEAEDAASMERDFYLRKDQDQFAYLSSEEDDDDDEVLCLGKNLSEKLDMVIEPALYKEGKGGEPSPCTAGKQAMFGKQATFGNLETEGKSGALVRGGWRSETTSATSGLSGHSSTEEHEQSSRNPRAGYENKLTFAPVGNSFLERYQSIKKQTFAEDFWPEYRQDMDMAGIERRAQAAYAALLVSNEITCGLHSKHRKGFEEKTEVECACQKMDVERFLAMYFMDPDVFPVDESRCASMLVGEYTSECVTQDHVIQLDSVPIICKAHLFRAVHTSADCEMPDSPVQFLASALQRTPVLNSKRSVVVDGEEYQSSRSKKKRVLSVPNSPRTVYSLVRRALLRHATRECSDTSELESVLMVEGLPPRQDEDGESLMCLATAYGDVKALALLFAHGGDLNEAQLEGLSRQSSLDISATFGHERLVAFLVANGAFCGRALHLAVKARHVNIVAILLRSGADPSIRIDGFSSLGLAVIGSDFEMVRMLLRRGGKLDNKLSTLACRSLGLDAGSTIVDYAEQEGLGRQLRAAREDVEREAAAACDATASSAPVFGFVSVRPALD